MKKLIASAVLAFSMSAQAEPTNYQWGINDVGAPVVYEQDWGQALLYNGCGVNELWIFDSEITNDLIGIEFIFKVRVDRFKIREYMGSYHWHEGLARLVIDVPGDLLTEMVRGTNLRIQFPAENDRTLVETYSLIGFTDTVRQTEKRCSLPERDYFQDNNGNEYFRS